MYQPQSTYQAYLLRLRRVDNAGQPVWRISLEVPGSQTQRYFDDLTALCHYLATQMNPVEEGGEVNSSIS